MTLIQYYIITDNVMFFYLSGHVCSVAIIIGSSLLAFRKGICATSFCDISNLTEMVLPDCLLGPC